MSASARRTVSGPGVLPSGAGMKVYDDSTAGAGVDLKSGVVIKYRFVYGYRPERHRLFDNQRSRAGLRNLGYCHGAG